MEVMDAREDWRIEKERSINANFVTSTHLSPSAHSNYQINEVFE
jgi:hypothetical protein